MMKRALSRAVILVLLLAGCGWLGAVPVQAAVEDCSYAGYLLLDRPQERLAACAVLLNAEADDGVRSRILVYRSWLKSGLRDDAGALSDTEEAVRLGPGNADAYVRRGMLLDSYGKDPRAAIADYSRAIELKPSFTMAMNFRANAEAKLGEYEQAIGDLTRAIQIGGDYNLYIARGGVWRLRGDYARAIADFEAAVKGGATSVLELDPSRATLALGPALAAVAGQKAPAATEFAMVPAERPFQVEVWRSGGAPGFCALASSGFDKPAWAIARGEAGYAVTLSASTWQFVPGSSYPVTLIRNAVSQPATATALGDHTIGVGWAANSAIAGAFKAPSSTYEFQIKTAAQSVPIRIINEPARVDECWDKLKAATNPFGAAGPSAASNPFEVAPVKP